MQCTSPRTVGYQSDGKTLSWSLKNRDPQYATFQLPCGKCIECLLGYSRQWATRCVHESKMHEESSFITLTYKDEHLPWLEDKHGNKIRPTLKYEDFQNFMKKLRKLKDDAMGYIVAGEYGGKNKRPHWHAIIFNWRPRDLEYFRKNEHGDTLYTSDTLDRIWGKNDPELRPNEVGDVTFKSAGYCARYAAKKLEHGHDKDHPYHPIFKVSNKNAIGKKWLEVNWRDVFNHGRVVLDDGTITSIPRYYEKWFKENEPTEWERYVTREKVEKMEHAQRKSDEEMRKFWENVKARSAGKLMPLTPNQIRNRIITQKLQMLQGHLKL